MKVTKTVIPVDSILNSTSEKFDYSDSFKSELNDPKNTLTSVDFGRAFFSSSPKWVSQLFILRNKIVGVFGLKTPENQGDRQSQLNNFTFEKGQQLGHFSIFEVTNNEVIIGQDDKHLDFRVSLFISYQADDSTQKLLTISTTVAFKNWFGKLYFLPVMPLHRITVPTMLKVIVKNLESNHEHN
jgi:hypothetical protein